MTHVLTGDKTPLGQQVTISIHMVGIGAYNRNKERVLLGYDLIKNRTHAWVLYGDAPRADMHARQGGDNVYS